MDGLRLSDKPRCTISQERAPGGGAVTVRPTHPVHVPLNNLFTKTRWQL